MAKNGEVAIKIDLTRGWLKDNFEICESHTESDKKYDMIYKT